LQWIDECKLAEAEAEAEGGRWSQSEDGNDNEDVEGVDTALRWYCKVR